MTRKPKCYGPAPEIRGRVHGYWLQQAQARKQAKAQGRKGTSLTSRPSYGIK